MVVKFIFILISTLAFGLSALEELKELKKNNDRLKSLGNTTHGIIHTRNRLNKIFRVTVFWFIILCMFFVVGITILFGIIWC